MLVAIIADFNGDNKTQQTHIADALSTYDAVAKCITGDANSVDEIDLTKPGAFFLNEQYARGIVAVEDPVRSPTSYMPDLCIESGSALRQSTFEVVSLAQIVQCVSSFSTSSFRSSRVRVKSLERDS